MAHPVLQSPLQVYDEAIVEALGISLKPIITQNETVEQQ